MIQHLKSLLFALILALLPSAVHAQEPGEQSETIRLGYLFSDGQTPATIAAVRTLLRERPDLVGRVKFTILTESTYEAVDAEHFRKNDVLVFDTMNQQMLERFNEENGADLFAENGSVLAVGVGLQGETYYTELGVEWDKRARAYWENGGPSNQLGLLKLALQRAGVEGLELPEPQLSLDFGYYYPDGGTGRVFADWDSFQQWRADNGKLTEGAPSVAISFFQANYYSGDMALVDAVIAEVESCGAEAVPIFGYPAAVAFRELVGTGVDARADVGLGLNFQFNDAQAASILEEVGIPVLNLISLYGRSEEDWRNSPNGLSPFEGSFNLASPELAGTIAPIVVGTKERVRDDLTGLTSVISSPIDERVDMAVRRGLRYAELGRIPNSEKKIALIYYNNPPGRANIGAAYLNVPESIARILAKMAEEGYDIGGPPPTTEEVLEQITTRGRNVINDAPGELEEMIAQGGVQRIPLAQYEQWLETYHPALRDKVLSDWGDPADSTLMTERIEGPDGTEVNFILPGLLYGNVLLMPQPSRAWDADLEKLYHAMDLAPPHQYVASYAWLRDVFDADAVVHIGTHGTLEWLDGRDAGLGPEDAPDALIADLPNPYIYNVDVVGEGLVARRRGMGTLLGHMVPPFVEGGLSEDLAQLSEIINDHRRNLGQNPELADYYLDQLRERIAELALDRDMGLKPGEELTSESLTMVEDYLTELRGQIIPYGLHAFGRVPEDEAIASTVRAILSVDRSGLPDRKEIFGEEMDERIRISGPRELDNLMLALSGGFVPAGRGGEPIRSPDAYPTGNNFYGIDPDKVPKPAAWDMGSTLAQQMIDDFYEENGAYPEKVSFVIWGNETMRHEGVLESQIFYLLGTRPVWDERGRVVDVEVIPREELGRPRVDILIASSAQGMFAGLTLLMDEAVQKVRVLDEEDNSVRKHYLDIKRVLIERGVEPETADQMAGVRIFDEPPGRYNLNTSSIVANSGSWDTDTGFANDYIRKMGHGFGNGYWGQPMPDVFALNLSGTQQVVHSNSTMLFATLDNDDMFMYMGGLNSAIRSLDGQDPELVLTDTSNPGEPRMIGLREFMGREFRSRYINPNWIKGMQGEGYAGARDMLKFVEYMWGWDAVATDVVGDAMWEQTYETYVQDNQNLGMKEFFNEHSPYAYQDITARMIETIRKGYWDADEEVKARLISEYLSNVAEYGVNCTEVSCGNGRMLEYVYDEAERLGVAQPVVEQTRGAFEQALGRTIDEASADLSAFVESNEARTQAENRANRELVARLQQNVPAQGAEQESTNTANAEEPRALPSLAKVPQPQAQPDSASEEPLRGQVMSVEERSTRPEMPEPPEPAALTLRDLLWPAGLFLLLLIGWRFWEMRRDKDSSVLAA